MIFNALAQFKESSKINRLKYAMGPLIGLLLIAIWQTHTRTQAIEKQLLLLNSEHVEIEQLAQHYLELKQTDTGITKKSERNMESLVSRVTKTADQKAIPLEGIQQLAEDIVIVSISDLDYSLLVNWLIALQKQSVEIRKITIQHAGKSGLINCRVEFISS